MTCQRIGHLWWTHVTLSEAAKVSATSGQPAARPGQLAAGLAKTSLPDAPEPEQQAPLCVTKVWASLVLCHCGGTR